MQSLCATPIRGDEVYLKAISRTVIFDTQSLPASFHEDKVFQQSAQVRLRLMQKGIGESSVNGIYLTRIDPLGRLE